jgi:hypothetical protein
MILKQTLKNHFLANLINIYLLVGFTVLIWCFGFTSGIIIISFALYGISTLPAIILHVVFYFKNKNMKVELNKNAVTIISKGEERLYTNADILNVVVYKSANMDSSSFFLTGMDNYYFARIITTQKKQIDLTCLLAKDIDKILRNNLDVPFDRQYSPFRIFTKE